MDVKNILKRIQDNIVASDSETRMNVCRQCEHLHPTTKLCMRCGCFMPAKTKIKNAHCPLGKW
jgi:ribosomal protein L32